MCIFGRACRQQQGIGGESRIKMHGLQRTHLCPCAPTQIQAAVARFPTPAVPEPPVVLAAQPVEASGLQAASVPMEQKVHLAQAQPVRLELQALRVRSAALERLVVLERLVLLELRALGELAVQLAASALMEQKVHLAQPVPRVQRVPRVRLVVLEPRRTGWGR